MNDNEMMYGNGCGTWIFALLILLMIGGGNGFGFGGNGQALTSAELQRGFDTNSMEQQIRGNAFGLADLGYALDNKIDNAKDYLSAGIGGVKDAVTTEGRAMQMQMADCCCTTQRNIDSVKFDMANYHADTNAVTVAQTQKILDALAQNKIDSLQAKVNELQTANMMCGIPRINPYAYGVAPQFATFNGCGCGGTAIY